ncbi:diacylglycerol O-acyltransferase [Mycobacterium sp. GA-1285]|uniref:wax ester/triacylglycerol synthase domain-containing protein n=1 Tax=Mycobacterium sp. GA-1285 TaxID=1772282 RepID=UPI0007462F6E|nr:wax ester/triacylglycerol synthase domain-containing protein [Mycobacterium sp. GA-1285]KUI14009.1 diacylglycerol O-acyltransferase [Mycobacterium sp. GA-1285]
MTAFMRNTDAFTWAMESDPRLRSTVVTVIMLDRVPDWGEVRRRFDRVSRMLPMFRQRVVQSPPPAPPRWEQAPDFDLDFHMRRVTAPTPGTLDTVLEMARLAQMADFDRARPLWEATLIDGLTGGAAAVLCRFHHALTDGVGGVQIGMILFDIQQQPNNVVPLPEAPPAVSESWFSGYRDALRYNAGLAGAAMSTAITFAPRWLSQGIRRPLATVNAATATAASVYRTVRPVNSTGSPLITRRSLVRRLGVHDVSLQRLREAAHRCDCALNDAFVAGVAGGLRRYHDKHGVVIGDLHLTMPINLRTTGEEMGGNRITLMRFDIPAGLADPAQRMREIRSRTGEVRHERAIPYTQAIAGVLNLMPRWYIGSILRHVDFVASDVPGIPIPVYLGGSRVTAQYAFGPTIGAAVNVTLLTYADTCHLGLNVDTGAIPDYDLFRSCLVEGFDEVLTLAD